MYGSALGVLFRAAHFSSYARPGDKSVSYAECARCGRAVITPGATSSGFDMPNGCPCGGRVERGVVVAGLMVEVVR